MNKLIDSKHKNIRLKAEQIIFDICRSPNLQLKDG